MTRQTSFRKQVDSLKECIKYIRTERNKDGLKTEGISFICIGTDRSTGDSFGPLVGTALEKKLEKMEYPVHVIGNIDNPVHAMNLEELMPDIQELNKTNIVIAVDCALVKASNLGKLVIVGRGIVPGAGMGKNLPEVGDIAILGGICKVGEQHNLVAARLSHVFKLVSQAEELITKSLLEINIKESDVVEKIESIMTSNNKKPTNQLDPDVAFVTEVMRILLEDGTHVRTDDITRYATLNDAYTKIFRSKASRIEMLETFSTGLDKLVGASSPNSALKLADYINSILENRRCLSEESLGYIFKGEAYKKDKEKILTVLKNYDNITWGGSTFYLSKDNIIRLTKRRPNCVVT